MKKKKTVVKAEKGEATKAMSVTKKTTAADKKKANARKADAKKTAAKKKRKPIVVLDPLDLQAGPGGIDPILGAGGMGAPGMGMAGPGGMGLDPMMQGSPMGDPMAMGGPIPPGPQGMPLAPEAMPRKPLPRRRLV